MSRVSVHNSYSFFRKSFIVIFNDTNSGFTKGCWYSVDKMCVSLKFLLNFSSSNSMAYILVDFSHNAMYLMDLPKCGYKYKLLLISEYIIVVKNLSLGIGCQLFSGMLITAIQTLVKIW